jgi:hypothetical protein
LRVRPRQTDQPAVVGSLFVDAATGAVVRMDFTFTRAAYIDRRLDYINVSLENGLWRGRFWLPHEQRLEIRREVPELDFPVGTIIRTRMRVGNYRFNEPIPPTLFYAPRITASPRAERERFAFEQAIDAERRLEGIGRPLDVAEVRREARQLLRQQALSGLPQARFRLDNASDLFRYNRAEGAVLGLGGSFRPAPQWMLRVHGGWAFGAGYPLGRVELAHPRPLGALSLSAYANQPRDVGIEPAASGALNTLSSLLAGVDYSDLFAATGAAVGAQRELGARWFATLGAHAERQRSLERSATGSLFEAEDLRAVRPIDDGTHFGGALNLRRVAPTGTEWVWRAEFNADGGVLQSDTRSSRFVQPRAMLGLERNWGWRDAQLDVEGSAGTSFGEIPRQALFLAGGRGTVAGYDFRSFGGDRYALGRTVLAANLARPWLRGRALAEAGLVDVGQPGRDALKAWGAAPTSGIRTSVGAGVGIFYDLLRVDVARGLGDGGRWEVSVEAQRAFWDWL